MAPQASGVMPALVFAYDQSWRRVSPAPGPRSRGVDTWHSTVLDIVRPGNHMTSDDQHLTSRRSVLAAGAGLADLRGSEPDHRTSLGWDRAAGGQASAKDRDEASNRLPDGPRSPDDPGSTVAARSHRG